MSAKDVIAELCYADRIIRIMLNAMTPEQKQKCAQRLESEGVSPDGMARYYERRAALAAVGAA